MKLHNRVNSKVLKQKLHDSSEERRTLSFYRYAHIADPAAFRARLYAEWHELGILGRIYVAKEGINGQVSVPVVQFDAFTRALNAAPLFQGMRLNFAVDDGKSFFKLKVQVRNKIVADGLDDERFDASDSGIHLDAAAFNRLADQPGTIIVDMRNHYESEVGHFKNAICPDVDAFRDALPEAERLLRDKKDDPIIMYCTGGIRCEKASAWLKHRGFHQVYQLDGGIIEYARRVSELGLENKFIGKNFVFDERLGEKISSAVISTCHQCGTPCDAHTNCTNDGCHLLFIQCESCRTNYGGCCSEECRTVVALPQEEQRELRKGKAQGRNVFKKGRSQHLRIRADPS